MPINVLFYVDVVPLIDKVYPLAAFVMLCFARTF